MNQTSESGVERVQRLLREAGCPTDVVRLDNSARTAAEAAAAIGCDVAQIAKSIVFRGASSGRHLLIITSGRNRVDEGKVAAHVGEPLAKADADFVRDRTGFAIGGVAPIGHAVQPARVLIDADLGKLNPIWAAAGHTHAVFRIAFPDLVRLSGGEVVEVA